jgi:hypothetical protein
VNVFTEPLHSNYREVYTYRHTDSWEGFMKYAVEIDSGAIKYIQSFRKTGSGIQTLIRLNSQIQTYRHRHRHTESKVIS